VRSGDPYIILSGTARLRAPREQYEGRRTTTTDATAIRFGVCHSVAWCWDADLLANPVFVEGGWEKGCE